MIPLWFPYDWLFNNRLKEQVTGWVYTNSSTLPVVSGDINTIKSKIALQNWICKAPGCRESQPVTHFSQAVDKLLTVMQLFSPSVKQRQVLFHFTRKKQKLELVK